MTAATLTDRELLKSVLIEVIEERPELFKAILKEIIAEGKALSLFENNAHSKEIESLIQEDFDEIGDVYKALA